MALFLYLFPWLKSGQIDCKEKIQLGSHVDSVSHTGVRVRLRRGRSRSNQDLLRPLRNLTWTPVWLTLSTWEPNWIFSLQSGRCLEYFWCLTSIIMKGVLKVGKQTFELPPSSLLISRNYVKFWTLRTIKEIFRFYMKKSCFLLKRWCLT